MKKVEYEAGQMFVSNGSERRIILLCESDCEDDDGTPIWKIIDFSSKWHGGKSAVRESTIDIFFKPIEEFE